MPTFALLHCADASLAAAASSPERARDRLAAFERVVDDALNASADAILVPGDLLARGPLGPMHVHELESLLDRARAGGAPVVVTCERGEEGWLAYLAARERLVLLAASADGVRALPAHEPARGLRLVGLGRPASAAALEERLARLGELPRERGALVALLSTSAVAPAPRLLDRLAAAADYVALGGGRDATLSGASVRDPGPLVRPDPDAEAEPGYLLVKLERNRPVARAIPSGDRPLLSIRVDVSAETPEELDAALYAELLARRTPGRALVRVLLAGAPLFDPQHLDHARLEGVVREAVNPLELRLHVEEGAGPPAGTGSRGHERRALERAVLQRLAGPLGARLEELARALLERLPSSPEAGSDEAVAAAVAVFERRVREGPEPDAHP